MLSHILKLYISYELLTDIQQQRQYSWESQDAIYEMKLQDAENWT